MSKWCPLKIQTIKKYFENRYGPQHVYVIVSRMGWLPIYDVRDPHDVAFIDRGHRIYGPDKRHPNSRVFLPFRHDPYSTARAIDRVISNLSGSWKVVIELFASWPDKHLAALTVRIHKKDDPQNG